MPAPPPCSIYDFAGVVAAAPPARPVPVLELVTRSKLSCLAWNRHMASHVASSDYEGEARPGWADGAQVGRGAEAECLQPTALKVLGMAHGTKPPPPLRSGVVVVWDVASSTPVAEYEAHSKRIWSLDYCAAPAGDPSLLASASDDCTVKLWSMRSPNSVVQVGMHCTLAAGAHPPLLAFKGRLAGPPQLLHAGAARPAAMASNSLRLSSSSSCPKPAAWCARCAD